MFDAKTYKGLLKIRAAEDGSAGHYWRALAFALLAIWAELRRIADAAETEQT